MKMKKVNLIRDTSLVKTLFFQFMLSLAYVTKLLLHTTLLLHETLNSIIGLTLTLLKRS